MIRVGIIGTGGIAHAHMRSYLKMEDVQVVAGCDIIPGKAAAFFAEFGVEASSYLSVQEMLEKEQLDAVSVCTYNTTHAECAIAALDAGLHVLLEKPMTVHLDEAVELMRHEKASGKILTIGFQPRYDSKMVKVREIVQSGRLGRIYYVQTGGGRYRGIPGRTFVEKDKAGVGALADIGCYALDMCLSALGYPKPLTVSAVAYDYLGKDPRYSDESVAARFTVDDFSAAFIRLEGGITLDFRMSWAMNMDTTGATIFLGTEAGLKIQPTEGPWGGAWDGTAGPISLWHTEYGVPTHTPIPLEDKGEDRFFLKVRSFVDAIEQGLPAPIPTSQIIYNQAIIDAIQRSNETGHEVEIVIPEI